MNVLELFAGAGGGILGSRLLGHRTVCAVELDPYCREILLRRQEEGHLEPFPIWDDVRTFDGRSWRGTVDIVAGGFPCQPWSVAGKQKGETDSRNLWPDTFRVICEVEPRFAFLENVPGLACKSYFWEQVLPGLAEAGFDVRWEIISAADVGAPHLRKRLWIYAYPDGERQSGRPQQDVSSLDREQSPRRDYPDGLCDDIPDSERVCLRDESRRLSRQGRQGSTQSGDNGQAGPVANNPSERRQPQWAESTGQQRASSSWWEVEPDMGRVVDGLAHRVDRLRALGNGQVPAVVAEAWKLLSE